MVSLNLHNIEFFAACGVPGDLTFDLNEVIDLSWASLSLAPISEETLLAAYKESFLTHNENTYLHNWPLIPYRIFGTIMPKYRNKPPLKYNLNDTQIVMALCFKATGTNLSLPNRPYMPFSASSFKQLFEGLRYVSLQLLPVALTQSRYVVGHNLSHIQFGGCKYYHPALRVLSPPLWISGCSYNESIKQPEGSLNNTITSTATRSQAASEQQGTVNCSTTIQSVATNNMGAALMSYHQHPQQQHQLQQYYAVTTQQQPQAPPNYMINVSSSLAQPSFTFTSSNFMPVSHNNFTLTS